MMVSFKVWYFYNSDHSTLVHLTFTSLLMGIFSIGLSVGVVIAVGGLLYLQLKAILRNQTGIEDWIVTKANSRARTEPFVYPYNLGAWENAKLVFLNPLGDGINWPVRPECHQYTLTVSSIFHIPH